MKMLTGFVAAAVVAGPLAYSSQAVLVKNVTTNTVLFSDGFEDATVGGTMNPTDGVGSWAGFTPTVSFSGVTNEAASGFAAYDGDQFTRIVYRRLTDFPSPDNSNSNVLLESNTFSAGSVGDVIELTLALRVESHIGAIRLQNSGAVVGDLFFHHSDSGNTGGSISVGGGGVLGVTHNEGAWNVVVIRYEQGNLDGFMSLSVNGSAFETTDVRAAQIGASINQIAFRTSGATTTSKSDFYIDAIPEPASLALLGMGGLMMLRRRRIA